MKILKKLALSLIFGYSALCWGQSYTAVNRDHFLNDFVSKNWTASDGLPGNTITDVIQDATGYLYIGTYDGLVRFDGVEFVTFNKGYDQKYDFVSARSIFQDSNKNIWVGANDEGITMIHPDGTTEKFNIERGLPNNSVRAITEDQSGNIWVGTAAGLVYITKDKHVIRPEGLEPFHEENILVSHLFCDTAGRIWVVSPKENGVYIYANKKFEQYDRITKIQKPIVNYVTQDNSGALWFGISPHYAVKITSTSEVVYNVGNEGSKGTMVNKIYQDRSSNIWFALDNGVTILHGGEFSYFNTSNGLSDEKVAKIIEDREGNIWLATDRSGLQRLSRSKFKTTTMTTSVNAICEDIARKVVWVGADNGLYCVQNENFVENELTNFCSSVRIRDVSVSRNGDILVSTYEKLGLVKMDQEGKITSITKADGLIGNKTRVSLDSSNGDIYVGTTTGLSIIDHNNGIITPVTKANGVTNDYIMCLHEDKAGNIWCGTDGGGIFILNKGSIVKTYTTENGLAGNVIFKITEVNDNEIWIFTGTGVSRYITGSNSFQNFNSTCGFGVDGIFQGIPDYTGKIWMTSNKGIFSAKLEDLENYAEGKLGKINVRYFGQSDGLVSGGATSTSRSMKDSLGRIWFTLIDGFSIYDPMNVTANKTSPLIKIEEVTIDNDKYDFDGKPVVLAPETKRFSLKFTGLSFISSEQMKFRTKLAGFDTDFSDWTTLRTVSYTNLNHGTYRFTFQAENSDEVLSDVSQELIIIKKPYIWELVWFWILIAILVFGIVALIIYNRFRRMRLYQITLENEVRARTHDLQVEKEKSESLLLNILPAEIAQELTERPKETIAKKYPMATVLFTDIVGFTKMSDSLTAEEVVKLLNELVSKFDERAKLEGVEKIKTIGDAYMAATGLSENPKNDGASKMVKYAKGILEDVAEFNRTSSIKVQIRIGINSGNLVAGVIGTSKFIYDIWGDTVNVASRMESSGTPMQIHVTGVTYLLTEKEFEYSEPTEIDVKGKGLMKTYYVK